MLQVVLYTLNWYFHLELSLLVQKTTPNKQPLPQKKTQTKIKILPVHYSLGAKNSCASFHLMRFRWQASRNPCSSSSVQCWTALGAVQCTAASLDQCGVCVTWLGTEEKGCERTEFTLLRFSSSSPPRECCVMRLFCSRLKWRLLSWLHSMKSISSTTDFNIDSVKALDTGCIQAYTKDIARVKPEVWIQSKKELL